MKTPFRYDFVGSFLRPQRLKDARKAFENGAISQEELTAVEDDCIKELVAKTKELGYHVITDGEFRRSTWHLDFMWGFASCEIGNKLTEEQQWAKLKLVKEIAEEVWGKF